jgi:hypothetical protein
VPTASVTVNGSAVSLGWRMRYSLPVHESVSGRAEIAAWLHVDELHLLCIAERVAHRVASRLERLVGRDAQRRVERVHDIDDAEIHQDRVVAAEE